MQPYQLIVKDPIPVWLVGEGHSPDISDSPVKDLMLTRDNPQFRGVPIDRLLNVIQTGVDVEPTNAPIWCGDLDKAFEYARSADGRFGPGLVFALRRKMLERTYKTLPLDASAADIATIRDLYPNRLKLNNELWFSRLAAPTPGYEAPYGFWIPGDPKEALMAIFLIGKFDDLFEHIKQISAAVRASAD